MGIVQEQLPRVSEIFDGQGTPGVDKPLFNPYEGVDAKLSPPPCCLNVRILSNKVDLPIDSLQQEIRVV